LKLEPANEESTYMLANLMLIQDQAEGAISTYIELLDKSPDNFNILANLIELLRRAGKI
jgi:cytochrome c-type biogenesis protein CcmH/NrfG